MIHIHEDLYLDAACVVSVEVHMGVAVKVVWRENDRQSAMRVFGTKSRDDAQRLARDIVLRVNSVVTQAISPCTDDPDLDELYERDGDTMIYVDKEPTNKENS